MLFVCIFDMRMTYIDIRYLTNHHYNSTFLPADNIVNVNVTTNVTTNTNAIDYLESIYIGSYIIITYLAIYAIIVCRPYYFKLYLFVQYLLMYYYFYIEISIGIFLFNNTKITSDEMHKLDIASYNTSILFITQIIKVVYSSFIYNIIIDYNKLQLEIITSLNYYNSNIV